MQGEEMVDQPSVVPVKVESAPKTGGEPMRIIAEATEIKNLSDKDKSQLILYAQERYKNWQRKAYCTLAAILISPAHFFVV